MIIPPSFVNLSDLETLYVDGSARVLLPDTLWDMKKLRHLGGTSMWVLPSLIPVANLENLLTLSEVEISSCQIRIGVLKKLPNLRSLICYLDMDGECTVEFFTLNQLESLFVRSSHSILSGLYLPQSLKERSLLWIGLPLSEVSAIERLPSLEFLKLSYSSFSGEKWNMEEEGTFPKLNVLEIKLMVSLERWTTASDDNFPSIETLILNDCPRLEEIPSCIAQSSTLQMIKVNDCPRVINSIKEIHEMQMDLGNEDRRIYLNDQPLTKE
ncbi:OLC1v1012558C1 [Oldenlandia corymbosa var. corymbosa]|uniref:OLC1v1012558C1 n=1 Tax=Oldenlandia corymbosa var. corymbosa TaxID=529605 RepID=A0AAV1DZ76_OLDCO|nr:OLC1v1012558C1 [Oldenlandia corymbosa var. corymbosa]